MEGTAVTAMQQLITLHRMLASLFRMGGLHPILAHTQGDVCQKGVFVTGLLGGEKELIHNGLLLSGPP